jgi:hypothetical protein
MSAAPIGRPAITVGRPQSVHPILTVSLAGRHRAIVFSARNGEPWSSGPIFVAQERRSIWRRLFDLLAQRPAPVERYVVDAVIGPDDMNAGLFVRDVLISADGSMPADCEWRHATIVGWADTATDAKLTSAAHRPSADVQVRQLGVASDRWGAARVVGRVRHTISSKIAERDLPGEW